MIEAYSSVLVLGHLYSAWMNKQGEFSPSKLEQVLAAVANRISDTEKVDLVVLAGDYVYLNSRDAITELNAQLIRFFPNCSIYAIPSNHELCPDLRAESGGEIIEPYCGPSRWINVKSFKQIGIADQEKRMVLYVDLVPSWQLSVSYNELQEQIKLLGGDCAEDPVKCFHERRIAVPLISEHDRLSLRSVESQGGGVAVVTDLKWVVAPDYEKVFAGYGYVLVGDAGTSGYRSGWFRLSSEGTVFIQSAVAAHSIGHKGLIGSFFHITGEHVLQKAVDPITLCDEHLEIDFADVRDKINNKDLIKRMRRYVSRRLSGR